ncbi:ferric reductase-like transmembrane domain-containing protein [Peribacillus kribbensis]|uniref:ferric reductase-like transmembrane domain-containing protein n=1 Tax=Peribacillus kribbensis TaxID=356658 RepID=UPI00040BF1E9|nr:ferric reductase-like transmembrane domain-containing protein [Peribacillus kribbensis]
MNWTWFFIRVTGLTAYLLLTISLTAGMFLHLPKKKGNLLVFHQILGQVALLLIGVHAYLLVFDHYQPYSLKAILIPFASGEDRVMSGIGIIAMYLLLIVIITSDFMKKVGKSLWKKLHYLVFPAWILSAVHGLFLGSDSGAYWGKILYAGTTAVVVLGFMYLITSSSKKKKQRQAAYRAR